jgi:AcrR family transcriptional regulator
MLQEMEAVFAASGRTPKGRRALKAIFQATMAAITNAGTHGSSLDTIAANADLTQAALRHHFPSRDELLTAVFKAWIVWIRSEVGGVLADTKLPATAQLKILIETHLMLMETVDSAFWLEGSAYWIRTAPNRRVRNQFYRWLMNEYALLIGRIRPDLGKMAQQDRAFAVLSLVLGAWITHGRGSSWHRDFHVTHRRKILVQSATDLASA